MTLAAEAASEALQGQTRAPAALIFASTSPPYDEGGSAQVLAELLGLGPGVFTLDLASTARDGVGALRVAHGLLAASTPDVLVCGAHRRRHSGEQDAGDGAVALLLGAEGDLAELAPGGSHSEELRERWRLPGDPAPREADRSFTEEFGAARVARIAAERARGDDATAVHVAGPSLRAAARVERALDGPGDDAAPRTGLLGSAHALLRLLLGLDRPALVVAAAGGLADVVGVTPGPGGPELAARARQAVASGVEVDEAMPEPRQEGFAPYASSPRAWRERGQDLRLEGVVRDGRVLYPPPAGVDGERRPLAREGSVLTWTRDHVYPGADLIEMAVVELDDGARFYGQAASGERLEIGGRVRLVPRRLHAGGGMVQYFWKAAPCP